MAQYFRSNLGGGAVPIGADSSVATEGGLGNACDRRRGRNMGRYDAALIAGTPTARKMAA